MLTLDDIIGQPQAVAALRGAIASNTLPHALLFAGPVGVGKSTTARAMGQVFLCEKPDVASARACGRCEACRLYHAGTHPDFHVITRDLIRYHDKTGKSKGIDLSINVLRPELIEPANRKAAMNVGKVFIVEEAETMNLAAQNAILKTLEEPAGRTVIVLVTPAPDALLPTIRSRCQTIRFRPLSDEMVMQPLLDRKIDPEAARAATRLAQGSVGLALRWIDDGVLDHAAGVQDAISTLLSGRSVEKLGDVFKKSADAWAARQLERDPLGSKDQATRDGYTLYLTLATQPIRARMAETADADRHERLCQAVDAIHQAADHLDANVNVSLVFAQLGQTMERLFVEGSRQ